MRFFNWWVAKLNSRVEEKYQGKGRKVQTSAIESGHRNCIAVGNRKRLGIMDPMY
jgi:hypothetical protein